MHKWVYRNPADRTCKLCGRREVEYVMAWEGKNPLYLRGWWEEAYPISTEPCIGRFTAWIRKFKLLLFKGADK